MVCCLVERRRRNESQTANYSFQGTAFSVHPRDVRQRFSLLGITGVGLLVLVSFPVLARVLCAPLRTMEAC